MVAKKKNKRKVRVGLIVTLIIIILVISAGYMGVKKIMNELEAEKNAWKVEIINDKINVRSKPDRFEALVGEVKKGNVYKVIDINLDDDQYVWYQIELNGSRTGWIASHRNEPYVREINNPNADDENSYEEAVDYSYPEVKYHEEEYQTESIDTIKYDHLEINSKSDYEISHKLYVEECPTYTQYWIEYTITNKIGNSTDKLQKISFINEPNPDDITSLSKIRKKICLEG